MEIKLILPDVQLSSLPFIFPEESISAFPVIPYISYSLRAEPVDSCQAFTRCAEIDSFLADEFTAVERELAWILQHDSCGRLPFAIDSLCGIDSCHIVYHLLLFRDPHIRS